MMAAEIRQPFLLPECVIVRHYFSLELYIVHLISELKRLKLITLKLKLLNMKALLNARFLILILFFFIACKKDDTTPPAAQETLLSKADFSPTGGVHTYTYDAAGNMLTEVSTAGTSGVAFTTTFTNYDVMGRVTEYVVDYVSAAYTDEKTVISYNASSKIDRILIFEVNGGPLTRYSTFEYPASKQIQKDFTNSNFLFGRYEYTYSVDGKNVIELKYYNGTRALRYRIVYSNFDTKKSNDFLVPYGYSVIPASDNNFQNLTNTNHGSGIVTSSGLTYEYNSDGYVTKSTSSTGSIILFEYIKK
jgi:YD repeat-containing protein